MAEFKTDIEIAQACQKKKITEIAKVAGVAEEYLEQYGNYKAKVDTKRPTVTAVGVKKTKGTEV